MWTIRDDQAPVAAIHLTASRRVIPRPRDCLHALCGGGHLCWCHATWPDASWCRAGRAVRVRDVEREAHLGGRRDQRDRIVTRRSTVHAPCRRSPRRRHRVGTSLVCSTPGGAAL